MLDPPGPTLESAFPFNWKQKRQLELEGRTSLKMNSIHWEKLGLITSFDSFDQVSSAHEFSVTHTVNT